MRVQFSVDSNELSKLQHLASANGYPDVPTYCKDISLEERTYANLWDKVKKGIGKMPSGHVFALRDLLRRDLRCREPANLGVKLYENQATLGIAVNAKKDSLNTNTFTKL